MVEKNAHLIPQLVHDIADKIPKANDSERFLLLARLEAIRDFCDNTIRKGNANKR